MQGQPALKPGDEAEFILGEHVRECCIQSAPCQRVTYVHLGRLLSKWVPTSMLRARPLQVYPESRPA
jgi:hypothetical protein